MSYVIQSDKTVQQTLGDLRQQFKAMAIDDWEAYPEDKNVGYTVRYYRQGQWISAPSFTQPTKALNLRACYLLIKETWRFERLGMLAAFQLYLSQALVPVDGAQPDVSAEHYGILGVDPSATLDEIDAVFKTKARFRHPDTLGANATAEEKAAASERFKRLNAAYEAIKKLRAK